MKIVLTLIILLLSISCSRTSVFRMEGPDDFINKYSKNTLSLNSNKKDNREVRYLDVDLDTDYVFIKLYKWEKYFYKRDNIFRIGRDYKMFNVKTDIVTSTGFVIFTNPNDKYFKTSYGALRDWGEEYLIYVGKWQYVEKFKNYIRAVATTKGRFRVFFEFKNKDTEKIVYKPLKINKEIKNSLYGEQKIAIIEWFEKYGYNTYVDLKTGKIKQAEE